MCMGDAKFGTPLEPAFRALPEPDFARTLMRGDAERMR
jgi:hypothetical protein